MAMVGWLPIAELSFLWPDHREQPCVSQGSGKGSRKLLISLAANSHPPQLKGTPSPAETRKQGSVAELASSPIAVQPSLCSHAPSGSRSFLGRNCCTGRRQLAVPRECWKTPHEPVDGCTLHPKQPAALGGMGCN